MHIQNIVHMLLSGLYFVCEFANVLCKRNVSLSETILGWWILFCIASITSVSNLTSSFSICFTFLNFYTKNMNVIPYFEVCISCNRFHTSSDVSCYDKLPDITTCGGKDLFEFMVSKYISAL